MTLPIALPWFIVNDSPLSDPLVIIDGQRACYGPRPGPVSVTRYS